MSGAPPTPDNRDIVNAIDDTVDALLQWNAEWHAPLVKGQAHCRDAQIRSLAHLDHFSDWFDAHSEAGIVNQPPIQRLNDTLRAVRHRAAQLCDDDIRRETDEYKAMMADVSSFVIQARRLVRAFATASSELDSLTGIQNRLAMRRTLDYERARLIRSGQPSVLAFVDLDHFKNINDTHGHGAGDHVLRLSAARLTENVRAYDQVFRYGGEEFLVLLPDTELELAAKVLGRLRRHMENPAIKLQNGTEVTVTASFGAAQLNAEETVETTLERADTALYRAKDGGRNRVEIA